FAGATGPRVITLVANGGTAGEWDVPAGALLTQEQLTALQQGKLYVIATSVANPRGEIRGQIVPGNIVVTFSRLDRTPEVAALGASQKNACSSRKYSRVCSVASCGMPSE